MSASGFPGRRDEWYLAGMTTTTDTWRCEGCRALGCDRVHGEYYHTDPSVLCLTRASGDDAPLEPHDADVAYRVDAANGLEQLVVNGQRLGVAAAFNADHADRFVVSCGPAQRWRC